MCSTTEERDTVRDALRGKVGRCDERCADGQIRCDGTGLLSMLLCAEVDSLHRSQHGIESGAGDGTTVKVAFGHGSVGICKLELVKRPDGTSIKSLDGLQNSDTPVGAHCGLCVFCTVLSIDNRELLISVRKLSHVTDQAPVDG